MYRRWNTRTNKGEQRAIQALKNKFGHFPHVAALVQRAEYSDKARRDALELWDRIKDHSPGSLTVLL